MALLRKAATMDPDFSEWRDKPQAGDEDRGAAPDVVGHYLALKKKLVRKKKSGEIPLEKQQECIVKMTILTSLAELEFLAHIHELEDAPRLRLRSTGRIVLVKNKTDK